jgi:hypothetical protein
MIQVVSVTAMLSENSDIQGPEENSRWPQNSLIVPPKSLIGMQQFPAPLGREFNHQPPIAVDV